jgi:hypothetical protein
MPTVIGYHDVKDTAAETMAYDGALPETPVILVER